LYKFLREEQEKMLKLPARIWALLASSGTFCSILHSSMIDLKAFATQSENAVEWFLILFNFLRQTHDPHHNCTRIAQ